MHNWFDSKIGRCCCSTDWPSATPTTIYAIMDSSAPRPGGHSVLCLPSIPNRILLSSFRQRSLVSPRPRRCSNSRLCATSRPQRREPYFLKLSGSRTVARDCGLPARPRTRAGDRRRSHRNATGEDPSGARMSRHSPPRLPGVVAGLKAGPEAQGPRRAADGDGCAGLLQVFGGCVVGVTWLRWGLDLRGGVGLV